MVKNLSWLLLLVSLICFIVAWLLSTNDIFHDGNEGAWKIGGFIFLVLSMLISYSPKPPS